MEWKKKPFIFITDTKQSMEILVLVEIFINCNFSVIDSGHIDTSDR